MVNAKEYIQNLMKEYPNDFIFIVEQFGDIVKIGKPCTYRDDALKEYNYFLSQNQDLSFKVSIRQLNTRNFN